MFMPAQRISSVVVRFACAMLALATFAAVTGSEARAESPGAYMQRVANEMLAAQRSGGAQEAYATVVRSHADVPGIGLEALGTYASGLPKTDRPAYFNGMVNYIARYAAIEGPKYPVLKAIMVGQTKETKEGAYVDSTITLKTGESYDVRFRVIRRGGTWKVRDAEITGLSLLGTMATVLGVQFQNYIAANGGNPRALVLALNK